MSTAARPNRPAPAAAKMPRMQATKSAHTAVCRSRIAVSKTRLPYREPCLPAPAEDGPEGAQAENQAERREKARIESREPRAPHALEKAHVAEVAHRPRQQHDAHADGPHDPQPPLAEIGEELPADEENP